MTNHTASEIVTALGAQSALDVDRIEPDVGRTSPQGSDYGRVRAWRVTDRVIELARASCADLPAITPGGYVVQRSSSGSSAEWHQDLAPTPEEMAEYLVGDESAYDDYADLVLARIRSTGDYPEIDAGADTYRVVMEIGYYGPRTTYSWATGDLGSVAEAQQWIAANTPDGPTELAHNQASGPEYHIVPT